METKQTIHICAECGTSGQEVYESALNEMPDVVDPICCETIIQEAA